MARTLIAGTDDGLFRVEAGEARPLLEGSIDALAGDGEALWVVGGGQRLMRAEGEGSWDPVADLGAHRATCLLVAPEGVFVGSSEAHLFRLEGGDLVQVEAFEAIEGRDDWFTPWGGPPATRSLSRSEDGAIYANVHVGGIPRSEDGGDTWKPTLEVGADAHQVLAPPGRPGTVLAATARGLALSEDAGESWRFETEGLAASYARAVAAAGETLLLTASEGPRGGRAAIYRRSLVDGGPFERCTAGLPEWFDSNIDTGRVDASGDAVAFGTDAGTIYASDDGGETWQTAASELPSVRCLLVAP